MAETGTFYEYAMAGELAPARSAEGFADEIALLRANLRAEAQLRFGNLPALARTAEAIARLVNANDRFGRAQEDPWAGYRAVAEEIRQVMEQARPQHCAHCSLPTANATYYTEGENGRLP